MFGDGVWVGCHIKPSYKFQTIKSIDIDEYHASNQVLDFSSRSTRNHKHLIVNVSIEIPIKNKNSHNSLSPSPNQRKKSKLTQTLNQDRKITYQTNLNTLRDMQYMQTEMYPSHQPSRKKQTAPTPLTSARGLPTKYKSTELSPKRKSTSRKSK